MTSLSWSADLTVIGLTSDIIGFWILLWDLLPKYLHDRNANSMQHGIGLIESLHEMEPGEPYNKALARVTAFMNDSGVPYKNWHPFHKRRTKRNATRRFSSEFLRQTVAILRKRQQDEIKRSTEIERSRRRAPMLLGAGLVMLGFLFQLLGAIASG